MFLAKHMSLLSEFSKPTDKINFASVYLSTTRLNIARELAEREIEKEKSDWPEFAPDEKEAIDSLCRLSGPLVMASTVGRRLVTDNAVYSLKEGDEAEIDGLLSTYIKEVKDQNIASEETDALFDAVEIPPDDDPHPQRTRRVKFALVGSLMIVSAGAAVVAAAALPTAVAIAASPMLFVPYIWSKKVIENDPDFKEIVNKT